MLGSWTDLACCTVKEPGGGAGAFGGGGAAGRGAAAVSAMIAFRRRMSIAASLFRSSLLISGVDCDRVIVR